MKPFHFKNFTIHQNDKVFRVGTDGVLLGAMCFVENAKSVLEVGTGTGLISLMIAQRNPQAEIIAIDINENATKLARKNFQNSPYNSRIQALCQDFKTFQTDQKFNLILSNPPFFEENNSEKDVMARQKITLDFESLIQKSSSLLSESGQLSVIIPFQDSEIFEELCLKYNLHLTKKINISGTQEAKPKRVILEFNFNKYEKEELNFVIEKLPRKYSDEYLELTKEFHVFQKK